ncbi:hypothetical protein [Nocardioides sp. YIM 152588]|uniref:hypothetical protein n=1 Tax=Nocardioides sp. YIM 152588 TaxID=3158259 RepID=UPI0032E45D86
MVVSLRSTSRVLGAAVAVLLLAACGENSATEPAGSADSSPSATSAEGWPSCAEIWQEGGSVPSPYKGCFDEESGDVRADRQKCSSGQVLVTFDNAYYGVEGGPVNPRPDGLDNDKDYQQAKRACLA